MPKVDSSTLLLRLFSRPRPDDLVGHVGLTTEIRDRSLELSTAVQLASAPSKRRIPTGLGAFGIRLPAVLVCCICRIFDVGACLSYYSLCDAAIVLAHGDNPMTPTRLDTSTTIPQWHSTAPTPRVHRRRRQPRTRVAVAGINSDVKQIAECQNLKTLLSVKATT